MDTPSKQFVARKQILVNRPFQFKIGFYLMGWLIAISCAYPIIVYEIINSILEYLSLDPNGPDLSFLLNQRDQFFSILVFFHMCFIIMAFCMSLLMSYRIAGPLRKLHQGLLALAGGKNPGIMQFRKKDFFPELADAFNQVWLRLQAPQAPQNPKDTFQALKIKDALEEILKSERDLKKMHQDLQNIITTML